MSDVNSQQRKYVLATLLGAIAGGLVVALATKAIPKMMSQMMAGIMKNMMAQMKERDGTYPEMCQRMMQSLGEAQQEKAVHN